MKRIFFSAMMIVLIAGCEDKKKKETSEQFSIDLVGTIQLGVDRDRCNNGAGGSDIWGYKASDGSLYALMGTYYGVAVVEIPSLQVVDSIAGPQLNNCYYHRDIKTYGHYAYIVSENRGVNEGVTILDLQTLPDSVRLVGTYVLNDEVRSHNISIDEATGFAYIQNRDGNIRIVDLSNPEKPFDVGIIYANSVHDMFARNDTVWVAEGYNHSYAVFDVSDKSEPVLILRFYSSHTNAYTHNIWPDESGKLFATTEETAGVPVKVFEASIDYSTADRRSTYLGLSGLAHDVKVFKNRIYISHYESGISIVDIEDPENPVELGTYDTYPSSDNSNYNGCWGMYPFVDDGYIVASNVVGLLTVLAVNDPGI